MVKYLIYIRDECPPVFVEPICTVDTELEAIKIVKQSGDDYAYMPIEHNPKFVNVYSCLSDILIYKDLDGGIHSEIISQYIFNELKINIPQYFKDHDTSEFKTNAYDNMYLDYHCIHVWIIATADQIAKYGQTVEDYFKDMLIHKKIPEQLNLYYGEGTNYE